MTTYKADLPKGNPTAQALGLAARAATGAGRARGKEKPFESAKMPKSTVDKVNKALAKRQGRKT